MSVSSRYDNVIRLTTEEKDLYLNQILRILEELITHKSYIEERFSDLQRIALDMRE